MPFGIIGRTGPGMKHVVGFGDRSTEGVLLGANFGRAIVTNGDFSAYVCDMPQPSELRFGVVRAVGRCIAVLDWIHVVQGEGTFWGFAPHFHNGKCHWVAVSDSYAKT